MSTITIGDTGVDMTAGTIHLGNYTTINSTTIAISAFDGYYFTAAGTFSVSNGALYGGYINTYTAYSPGRVLYYQISGINLDVVTYNSYITQNNAAGLRNYVCSGNDLINGGSGNDIFAETGGNDTMHGGAGLDTLILSSPVSSYSITTSILGVTHIAHNSGSNILSSGNIDSVERIRFSDGNCLALDMATTQSAGETALLIGAVLPGQLVFDASKKVLLGAVINLFDSGYSMTTLAGALLRLNNGANDIWTVLAGGTDNWSIANYLLTNVNGHTPTASELTAAVSSLNSEATQGTWLANLALGPQNQTHINIVGLATTGLSFQ